MYKVKIVFWLHFLICATAHILGPLCVLALINWCLGSSALLFWDKCLVLGAVYAGAVFIANHVTNPQGFCSLTELEKHFRKELGLAPCGDAFLPRFYTKCRQISRGRLFKIPP